MLRVDEGDLDAAAVDGAALVGTYERLALDALGSQPAGDLEVADDFGLGRARDLERVVDVVEMAVRDEHEVAFVDLLQLLRRHRVAHHPWAVDDFLALRAANLPRAATNPGKAATSIGRPSHPSRDTHQPRTTYSPPTPHPQPL